MIENIENTDVEINGDIIVIPVDPVTISREDYEAQLDARISNLTATKESVDQALADALERKSAL